MRKRDYKGARIGHAYAVAVLTRDLHVHRQLGDRFDPVASGQAGVVAGAASQDQHTVDLLEYRSEEHTSELQSRENLVCRLLLEKKKQHLNKVGMGQHHTTV